MKNDLGLGKLVILFFLMKDDDEIGQFKYFSMIMEHLGTLKDNKFVLFLTTS